MSLSVTFEHKLEDQWDWLEHQRSKFQRPVPIRLVAMLAILGWLALDRGWNIVAWIFMGLAAFLALSPALARWQTNSLRQQVATMKPRHTAPVTVTLMENGLCQIELELKKETLFYWDAVKTVTELERIIAVELQHTLPQENDDQDEKPKIAVPMGTILIPKRAFESAEATVAFVAELRGKIASGEAQETPTGES